MLFTPTQKHPVTVFKGLFILLTLTAALLPSLVQADDTPPLPSLPSQLEDKYVIKVSDNGDAGFYVQNKEVIRFRSSANQSAMPISRLAPVKETLNQFITNGGNPRDIKPGEYQGRVVINAGNQTLLTVDKQSAAALRMSEKQLALLWTNQLRQALGADAIQRRPELVASRGFTPVLSQIRRSTGQLLSGFASWYGPGFHGRRTASGQRFDMNALTAAHKTLPMGTQVRVTNKYNGRSAIVTINDRGPYAHGRIIDLSKGAAAAVGLLSSGTAPVTVEVLGR